MEIARSHGVNIHAYADDLQTYVSCGAVNQESATTLLLNCIAEIDQWMTSNRVKLRVIPSQFNKWLQVNHLRFCCKFYRMCARVL